MIKSVSNINLACILNFLKEKNRDAAFLVEDLNLSIECLSDPKGRITWEEFNLIIEKLVDNISDSDLELIATYGVKSREYNVLLNMVSGLASARFLYWAQAKFFGTYLFKNIKYSYKKLSKSKIELTIDIQGQTPHPLFLEIYRRVYEIFPTLFGAKRSKVHLEAQGTNRATFLINLQGRISLKERFSTFFQIFKGAKSSLIFLSELQEKQIELDRLNIELNKRNKEKDLILKVVAHDINNPLTVIHHSCQNLNRKYSDEELLLKSVSRIQRSTSKLAESIDMVKSILKSENIHYAKTPLFLFEVLNSSVELVSTLAIERGVLLNNNVNNAVRILGDPTLLSMSVFSNLLTNCIRFSDTGSSVDISTVVGKDEVAILIRDHGVGMSQDKIKEILQQSIVHSSSDLNGNVGQGYGMLIAQSYLKTFNGSLRIESRTKEESPHDHGTLFILNFPKYDELSMQPVSYDYLQ